MKRSIEQLAHLKSLIDEASGEISDRVQETFNETQDDTNRILIAYHAHYDKPTFSLFHMNGAQLESFEPETFHAMKVLKTSTVSTEDFEYISEMLLQELANTIVEV